MIRTALAVLTLAVGLFAAGCGSSKPEDDGLRLESKTPPPVDAPATGAKPPEVEVGKGVEGEGK